MRYLNRPLSEWIKYGYNPIHLFGDYYLLRNKPKWVAFSYYTIKKIKKRICQ